ncbi:MAG: hypothetical protein U1F61_07420 [Opitutaceae bacterium]
MRRLVLPGVVVVVIAGFLAVFWRNFSPPPSRIPAPPALDAAAGSSSTGQARSSAAGQTPATTAASAANPPPRSELLDGLNDPASDITADLKLVNEVFNAWLTNFRTAGIPIGSNQEVTAALTGKNPMQFAFVPPDHPAINAKGELCDRWKTPFRFHVLSRQQMEIRSAGPDRKFGTEDDAEWAPWPKNF